MSDKYYILITEDLRLTSVQVILVVDTLVSYDCIYYEYYLNRCYLIKIQQRQMSRAFLGVCLATKTQHPSLSSYSANSYVWGTYLFISLPGGQKSPGERGIFLLILKGWWWSRSLEIFWSAKMLPATASIISIIQMLSEKQQKQIMFTVNFLLGGWKGDL